MHRLVLIALIATPALADGGVTVQLPDDKAIAEAASPELLTELVTANVIGVNCPAYAIDQGEWALLTGTADKIAAALKIDTASYDSTYYGPAFDLLDQPGSCEAEGPKIDPLIARLKAMGGDTVPLN